MIRPCDNCGGTGCQRCTHMPLLSIVHLEPLDVEALYQQGRTEFRPDPTTVMRWCDTHLSAVDDDDNRCHYSCCWDSWRHVDPDCEIVWIAKPTPLGLALRKIRTDDE